MFNAENLRVFHGFSIACLDHEALPDFGSDSSDDERRHGGHRLPSDKFGGPSGPSFWH